jgi:hypothetical protein
MQRRWSLAILLLLGCDDGTTPTPASGGSSSEGGGPGDAGGAIGGGAPSTIPIEAACVGKDEPTYQPFTDDLPQVPICADPDVLELPTEAHLIDLTAVDLGGGTCGAFLAFAEEPYRLPSDLPFPHVIRLPAAAPDAACGTLCDLTPTAFGLTLEYEKGFIQGDVVLAVRVPPPWFLVIGNETAPTPCLDGRPSILEQGAPLACATTFGRHLGFATAEGDAPSVDVVVDVISPSAVPNTPQCCPYACE